MSKAVLVLGVHRSGTSFVANVLNELGAFVENDYLKADKHNEKGYWESATLKEINTNVLTSTGFGEYKPPPLFDGWQHRPEISPLRDRARKFVERMNLHELWAAKDPAMTITLPFWSEVLPDDRSFIICVRNPLSVVNSMRTFWHMDPHEGSYLWMAYNLSAIANTFGQKRLILFYEDFMSDFSTHVKRIQDFLKLKPQMTVSNVFSKSLDHHSVTTEDLLRYDKIPWGAKLLYFMLLRCNSNDELLSELNNEICRAGEQGMIPLSSEGQDQLAVLLKMKSHPYVRFGLRVRKLLGKKGVD
jgi:hypothetical protein